jgi:hypothetical protein
VGKLNLFANIQYKLFVESKTFYFSAYGFVERSGASFFFAMIPERQENKFEKINRENQFIRFIELKEILGYDCE